MAIAEQIIQSFSKGSQNYDREAYVQGVAAKTLGKYFHQLDRLPSGPILEIGCGTGFITKELCSSFPDRQKIITDICPTMLEKCRSNVNGEKLNFSLLDGEDFYEENKFALIVSGLVFQWFRDFQASVQKLYEGLKPGGLLLFSFLEDKSFPEWQQACCDLNLPYTGNDFPLVTDLRPISTSYHLWEKRITLIYPNALQCLKGFKRIGANTALKKKSLSPSQMRQLLNYWDEQSPLGVGITYNIAYAAMQKW